MTDDAAELAALVEVWHDAATEVATLLRHLDDDDWDRPTDLPGWSVKAVASHLAHLEGELAGMPQQQVEVPEAPHIHGFMGQFTESGVIARSGWTPQQVTEDFETAVALRYAALTAEPPTDGSATGPSFAALVGWSWRTLLSNRPLDLWMHEQDIRAAVGRPGGLDSSTATHVAGVFAAALPFVWGKKAGAPPGSTLVLEVTGAQHQTHAVEVGADGRGRFCVDVPPEPTTRLTLDFGDWMRLAGGRVDATAVAVEVDGDADLASTVLANLAVTP